MKYINLLLCQYDLSENFYLKSILEFMTVFISSLNKSINPKNVRNVLYVFEIEVFFNIQL